MKIIFNLPKETKSMFDEEGWSLVGNGKFGLKSTFALGSILSLLLLFLFYLYSFNILNLTHEDIDKFIFNNSLVLILSVIPIVILHEQVHGLILPGYGYSPETLWIVMPFKFLIGIYYKGELSKRRFIFFNLSPFCLLFLLPTLLSYLFDSLQLWFLWGAFINLLGVGPDLVNAITSSIEIPPNSVVKPNGLKLYFRYK